MNISMDKKVKIGVMTLVIVFLMYLVSEFFENNKDETVEQQEVTEQTETTEQTEEVYEYDDQVQEYEEDYSNEEETEEVETYQVSTPTDELGIIADGVASQMPSDYSVTYDYDLEYQTGYIILTWHNANDLNKKDLNVVLESSGVKDALQEVADESADEFGKDIIVVLRDISNNTLFSCSNN